MVYALFYLPTELHHSLLATTHHFDDSKVLTPEVRSSLMRTLCTPDSDLHRSCGWATSLLSARDISAHSLAPTKYNLNAQAMDATINLIKEVIAKIPQTDGSRYPRFRHPRFWVSLREI